MPALRVRHAFAAGILLASLSAGCSRCGSGPPEVASQSPKPIVEVPEQKPPAVQTPMVPATVPPEDTPTPEPTAVPTRDPAVVAMCKDSITRLGGGDLAALDALPPEKRAALAKDGKTVNVLKCLAVATNNGRYCGLLPTKQSQTECLAAWELARELKTMPKEHMKAQIIYRGCLVNASKAECDKFRTAMTSRDAAKCKSVSKDADRAFCAALVSGDATRCKDLPDAAYRDTCAAYATDDATHCSKEAGADCAKLAQGFAAVTKEGLAGFDQIDATAAAASRDGKAACGPLLADLERHCIED